MKKAALVVDAYLEDNRIFEVNNKSINRDDCLHLFYELKIAFKKFGYDLSTSDINRPADSDFVIYNEMPRRLPVGDDCKKSFLLILESFLIRPDNWVADSHRYFRKIFTWHDAYVDNVKYFKINFSHKFPDVINKNIKGRHKLCTLIAGNKKSSHELELYSKRREAIDWFEANHPEDFDFYGMGWDRYYFSGPKIVRALNRIPPLTKLFAPRFKSYRGALKAKREVLEKYRFSLCYENARDIPGYITEKIFDSFFAGCIPIYWGANNIEEFIPKACFVDKRDFSGYAELYDFLRNMPEQQHVEYLARIDGFLNSHESDPFRSRYFAARVAEEILNAK